LETDEADQLIEHVMRCEHCAPLLRQAAEDMGDERTAAEGLALSRLESSSQKWQSDLGEKIASSHLLLPSEPSQAPFMLRVESKQRKHAVRWLYAAASLLVGIGVTAALWISHKPSVDGLLAKAYTEQRPMELRLAGAAPAPIRQERGPSSSPLSKPTSLLEAELEIKLGLHRSPNDQRLLADKGRSELLEWQYAEAIKTLNRVVEVDPSNPDLLRDLATAYFQRAESLHQAADYGLAIDNLSQALAKRPHDPVCLFNRAIVLERMFLYQDAIRDWQDYLVVDPKGPWSKEARQRLIALQDKLRAHEQSLLVPKEDPADAIAALRSRLLDRRSDSTSSNSLDEEYLEIATEKWLADFVDEIPRQISPAESSSAQALTMLSHAFEVRHDDRFLSDLLISPHTPNFVRATKLLSTSVASDVRGEPSSAYEYATKAAEIYGRIGNQAGELRSEIEEVYALQRSLKSGACLAKARRVEPRIDERSYPWMKARVLEEESACAAVSAEFQNAQQFAARAGEIANRHHFGNLKLRSLSLQSDIAQDKGDIALSWEVDRSGLDQFWNGSFSPLRAYAFYADLGYAAEFESRAPLAAELWKEAIPLISESPNRSTEGLARYRLGTDEVAAGNDVEASYELQRATSIFASLPQDDATRNYQTASEVSLATVELAQGNRGLAARHLKEVAPFLGQVTQYPTILDYYETLAGVQVQAGDLQSAEASLRVAVAIVDYGRFMVSSERDELGWERMSDAAYRKLVNVELLQPNRENEALAMWESSRSNLSDANPSSSARLVLHRLNLASITAASSRVAVAAVDITRILPHLRQVTLLTYAQLPDRLAIWAYDDRGIIFRQVAVPKSQFDVTSSGFARRCADPASDSSKLRKDGQQLYAWLIAPVRDYLSPNRTLWIEPDASVSRVPFQALVDPKGQYLAQQFALAERTGTASTLGSEPQISSEDHVLLVGSSTGSLDPSETAANNPLADVRREIQAVSSHFRDPLIVMGAQVDWSTLRLELQRSDLFHFAGHYGSNARVSLDYRAGIEPRDRFSSSPPVGGLAPRELRHCRLVVLSACSTGFSQRLGLFDPDGIVRTFLGSGAQLVVASRWDVDSAVTADLMDKFYSLLVSGVAPTLALRSAALAIEAQPESSHPYYWAAFETFGQE